MSKSLNRKRQIQEYKTQQPVIDKSAAIRIATALGWSPQRTWVGLTDERRKQLINKCWNEYIAGKEDASSFSEWISVAIEAELKEKNT
jgi:hypothetical protein